MHAGLPVVLQAPPSPLLHTQLMLEQLYSEAFDPAFVQLRPAIYPIDPKGVYNWARCTMQ